MSLILKQLRGNLKEYQNAIEIYFFVQCFDIKPRIMYVRFRHILNYRNISDEIN